MDLEEIKILMGRKENEHLEFKEARYSFSVLGDDIKEGKKYRKSVWVLFLKIYSCCSNCLAIKICYCGTFTYLR